MKEEVAAAVSLLGTVWVRALVILAAAAVCAWIVNAVMKRVIAKIAGIHLKHIDGRGINALRAPVYISMLAIGTAWALRVLVLPPELVQILTNIITSLVVLVWAVALGTIAHILFGRLSALGRFSIVQPRTQPVFTIVSMLIIWGGASYLILNAWDINVTAWLASAGILGIGVGFAAKDTLANLFSGIFIIGDAPYKLGDYIVLGSGERGRVTDIGIRSTRILTRDDIEITIPNAVIANTMIINESGGHHAKERIRCGVSVAYGSDIDRVREVLMSAACGTDLLCEEPEPRVRFRSFGASGLMFEVLGWIEEPELRGRAIDALNTSVYKELNAAEIEIPYAKHDVYIKQVNLET